MRFASAWGLLVAWTVLDLLCNVRYPTLAPVPLALLPSIDATVLLGVIAVAAWRGWRLPRALVAALTLALVIMRAYRVGDGIVRRYFNRPFDVALDLPTAGEIGRLMRQTVSPAVLIAGALVLAACAIGFAVAAAWAIRAAERSLAGPRARRLLAQIAATALAASLFLPSDGGRGLRQGAFAPSMLPRLFAEGRRLQQLPAYRRAQAARVRDEAARVAALPHDLARLRGHNVLLFFVESYGAVVRADPRMIAPIDGVYLTVQAQLGRAGFHVASRLIDSPTYGGRSQLAHQALFTGVRATNRVDDDAVQRLRPRTIADVFHDAGYRTLLVMPGTTHRQLSRWLYNFDRVYAAWDLGYQGPTYAFGAMPDQFVVDVIHRREVAAATQPLLIAYALISSHAPWDRQPPLLDDWASIGDGRVFAQTPAVRFGTNWSNLGDAAEAYVHAVAYDLDLLADYLTKFDVGDALVIVLGDHQPVADVTGGSASAAVPIHVISRDAALIDVFRRRGYGDGMTPARQDGSNGSDRMESWLPDLLVDFSRGGDGGGAVTGHP